ncbi:MAG: sodium:dicarboxylate symporter [Alteromonadaceae bacterium]|nr:MAG: sodium:dicarboxylate symporter [Alteromonadaceae bacterium]
MASFFHTLVSQKSRLALLGGLLAAVLMYWLLAQSGLSHEARLLAGLTVLCAIWWVFEPIPIPVTSILPIAILPLLGVIEPSAVAQSYGHPLILLLLGGFILSMAMERSGAHRHIALIMLHLLGGGSARRVVFGFMLATAALSMWISNTATTLMMLPVALAVIKAGEDESIAVPLLLGICYAASIGGMGTPIGTPPNLIFMNVYEETVGKSVSFLQWMSWSVPVVIVFVPLVGFWLTRKLKNTGSFSIPDKEPWTIDQKRVLWVFAITALAWITRSEPFGGWRDLLGLASANDASVALLAVVAMFIVPNGKGGKLLDWQTANKIPWGMLLLFSGGIALAKAFVATGLAGAIADQLAAFAGLPVMLMILLLCLAVTFLTEVTSNTASTSLLMPVLAAAAVGLDIDPLLLMVPAALSASCAFMLPVATVPNAVIFGSGKVTILQMVKAGFMLNIIGVLVITVLMMRLT